MMLARLGSLNALEEQRDCAFVRRFLGRPLPSADTMGRVFSQMDCDDIRGAIHHLYSRLKRNKALAGPGPGVLIVDGHESSSSWLRRCPGCLTRSIRTREGERTQFYHRQAHAMLAGAAFPLLLDAEEQRPGEDEVAAALRLCGRLLANYPRAFDVVLADGLYLRADFFKLFLDHGKDAMVVLKDERRDLTGDARGLFSQEPPIVYEEDGAVREVWDIEGFTSWESLGRPVRVIRSLETREVTRQRTGRVEAETSEWMWVTTLPRRKVGTAAAVRLGHSRWLIENRAFGEMVTFWHADHVYRHHPTAIIAFWLTLMLVLNLFRAFVHLNLKPALKAGHTQLHFARLICAELYGEWDGSAKPP
jgi:hypothetical protein